MIPSISIILVSYSFCIRCLYQYQIEGKEESMQAWEERFDQLDSKTLCDLAKVRLLS